MSSKVGLQRQTRWGLPASQLWSKSGLQFTPIVTRQ